MVGDSRKQVYLCRQQREGEPGCAEDLFGEELPGLLNERPSQPDRVVVDFRRRSKHWERL